MEMGNKIGYGIPLLRPRSSPHGITSASACPQPSPWVRVPDIAGQPIDQVRRGISLVAWYCPVHRRTSPSELAVHMQSHTDPSQAALRNQRRAIRGGSASSFAALFASQSGGDLNAGDLDRISRGLCHGNHQIQFATFCRFGTSGGRSSAGTQHPHRTGKECPREGPKTGRGSTSCKGKRFSGESYWQAPSMQLL